MALFASARDASLIRRLNREMMQRIVGIEVAVYKLAIGEIVANIYGETSDKRYYAPVRLHAVIQRDDSTMTTNDLGELDVDKTMTIGFLRDDLVDLNMVIEVSDIIQWDGGYYQIDNVRSSNYWWGRNPDTLIAYNQGEIGEFGYAVSIIAEVHRTSMDSLSLVDVRSGVTRPTARVKRPKFL